MAGHRLFDRLEDFGSAPALVSGETTVTYAQLAAMADDLTARLPSRRSLLFVEAANSIPSIAAYAACLRAGHVVHLFAGREPEKLAQLVSLYRPAAIIRQAGAEPEIEAACADGPAMHPDLALLMSTSGSTGSPKFVKLSHRNLEANALSIVRYLGIGEGDRAITSLQFHYSYGLSVVHSHLLAGAALVLTELPVAEAGFWDLFSRRRCTSFAGVPYSFELLARSGGGWASLPDLRYVTAAGGRMEPAKVRELARLGQRHGWDFFVMYGQTEAAPRMAYLPPSLAESHSDHIGRAIPGGALLLLDDAGQEVKETGREGELAYRGPNVMMGYALRAEDLAEDATPPLLRTGDIAMRSGHDLFRIVGRKARFVKPFGLRINLDEVEALARERIAGAVAGGDDARIVVAAPAAGGAQCEELGASLARRLSLPPGALVVCPVEHVPRLPNGKTDYRSVAALAPPRRAPPMHSIDRLSVRRAFGILASSAFYHRVAFEAAVTLGIRRPDWMDVQSIFQTFVGHEEVTSGSSFATLGGDSMSFVQTSLALESYLGQLPDGWERLSVRELEDLRHAPAAF